MKLKKDSDARATLEVDILLASEAFVSTITSSFADLMKKELLNSAIDWNRPGLDCISPALPPSTLAAIDVISEKAPLLVIRTLAQSGFLKAAAKDHGFTQQKKKAGRPRKIAAWKTEVQRLLLKDIQLSAEAVIERLLVEDVLRDCKTHYVYGEDEKIIKMASLLTGISALRTDIQNAK